jgi:penicillin-binding protein 1A
VGICPDSGKLATPGCPSPVQQGFLKDLPPSSPEAPPQEYCNIHGNQNVTEKVKVCTDPRHQGRLYLANIPKENESGGCPEELIAEIEVDNPEQLGYCPLTEHQKHR